MAAPSRSHDDNHANHEPEIHFTAQPYIPLRSAGRSTPDSPRTRNSDARTCATVCTDPPTPATHQEASSHQCYRATPSALCCPPLSETGSRGPVESDVDAVEEICRQLGQAELVKRHTGFGCPIAKLARADGLG